MSVTNGNKIIESHERRLDRHSEALRGVSEDVVAIKTRQEVLIDDVKKVEDCVHKSEKNITRKIVGLGIFIVSTLIALNLRSVLLG